jgi:hypothetical protein
VPQPQQRDVGWDVGNVCFDGHHDALKKSSNKEESTSTGPTHGATAACAAAQNDRFALALQSLCKRFAITLLSLCYRFAIALQSLCNHFAITLQSLCNRFSLALHSLCNRFALALQSLRTRFAIALQSLCFRFAIALQVPNAYIAAHLELAASVFVCLVVAEHSVAFILVEAMIKGLSVAVFEVDSQVTRAAVLEALESGRKANADEANAACVGSAQVALCNAAVPTEAVLLVLRGDEPRVFSVVVDVHRQQRDLVGRVNGFPLPHRWFDLKIRLHACSQRAVFQQLHFCILVADELRVRLM